MLFKKAVLIIHGFAGGTYDEEKLANFLELNRHYDVYQFTLPGHEKNLSKVSYSEWINFSEEMLNWLIKNGYKRIYLIGHSMGGVIATYLAAKYSEVKKIVLAAPAFQYLSVVKENLNFSKSLKDTPKIIKTYGSDEIVARFLKLNPSAIREFMALVKEYYDYPKMVTCPTLIIQGMNDDIVKVSSSKYVYDNVSSKIKKVVYVKDLTHDIFRGVKEKEIYKIVEDFLKHSEGGEYNI